MNDHGFICKECHGPAPVGVGYVANGPDAAQASAGLARCACGYSLDPRCPSWCSDHVAVSLDGGGVVHRRQTSPDAAPYVVRVEQFPDAAPGVYVQDAGGDDITAEQARAFARALQHAASLVEGGQR